MKNPLRVRIIAAIIIIGTLVFPNSTESMAQDFTEKSCSRPFMITEEASENLAQKITNRAKIEYTDGVFWMEVEIKSPIACVVGVGVKI